MLLKFRIYLICYFSVISNADNATVNYYVNLIREETSRALTSSLPWDSSFFSPTSRSVSVYGTFDYIIVGAGSAGAVVASRLSEAKESKILLLEAGGFETNFSDIPGMALYLRGLEFNWNYNTTPQTSTCLGMINHECPYPRGKGLGGSSIINSLYYVRGNRRDYDKWCDQGNPGWSYDNVLPYFKKSENAHIDGDEGYHGKNGYLNVEYHQPESPQFDAFIEANLELGRKVVDYNGAEQLGVAPTQLNSVNGKRHSTGKAFLLPAIDRPNLKILTYSLATKILIHSVTKKASGVLFSHNGQLLKAKARKEIILSAGSVGSPQLLMLSGVGPKYHLERHRIPVIQPLSVGNNLQDHPAFYGLHFETNYVAPIKRLEQYVKEYLNGFGPFTITSNAQGIGFLQTNMSETPDYPDIELIFLTSNNTNNFYQRSLHWTDDTYNNAFAKIDPSRTFSLTVVLLHPKSCGTLRLKSKNPYDYPLIDPRFLSDEEDVDIETLYQGIQLALQIVNTKAFKNLNARYVDATLPACQHHEYLSKAYWYCQLRQLTSHVYHPVGTCKMGPDPLKGAVVNHELKVHGVENLRVADASIIPEAISGHTNAPAIMIGEKVSDMIKNGKYLL